MSKIADESSVRPATVGPDFTYTSVYNPVTLWGAAVFGTVLGFARLSFGLLLPSMREDLGGNYSSFGLAQTANFTGYLLGTVALPALLSRYPYRARLALIGLLAMDLAMLATAASFDLVQLALWRLMAGFASALATVLALTLTVEAVQAQRRGQASGLVWSGAALGMAVAGLIAPLVLTIGTGYAWRLAWLAMGGVGLLASWGFYLQIREKGGQPATASAKPSEKIQFRAIAAILFKPRALLFVTLTYFFFGTGYIIGFTYFIALLVSRGMPPVWAGFTWAVSGFIGIFGAAFWGRLTDRYPAGWVLTASMLTGAISTVLMAVDLTWLQVVGLMIAGITLVGPPLIVTVVLRRELAGQQYTASFSLITAIFAIGQILGPTAGGLVADSAGLAPGILVGAGLLGLGSTCGFCHVLTRSHPV